MLVVIIAEFEDRIVLSIRGGCLGVARIGMVLLVNARHSRREVVDGRLVVVVDVVVAVRGSGGGVCSGVHSIRIHDPLV